MELSERAASTSDFRFGHRSTVHDCHATSALKTGSLNFPRVQACLGMTRFIFFDNAINVTEERKI